MPRLLVFIAVIVFIVPIFTAIDSIGNAAAPLTKRVPLVRGGLYGTDGNNLYLIDKTNGNTTLIGSHGSVENAIGALVFDSNGVLYGTSLTSNAQLYTIDTGTGAAAAVEAIAAPAGAEIDCLHCG